jgi:hypothetical protein
VAKNSDEPKSGVGMIIKLVSVLMFAVGVWYFVVYLPAQKKPIEDSNESRGQALGETGQKNNFNGPVEKKPALSEAEFGKFKAFSIAPHEQYERGEILVVDPPKKFVSIIRRLNFSVIEKVELGELGIQVYRLRTPAGMDLAYAKKVLAAAIPNLITEANHLFETQAGYKVKKTHPRAAIGWKVATPTCGRGIRIGMIDSAVDTSHPALKGQRVKFKSFHRKGRGPGPASHGTAVAGILVGKPEWGGLLPGAQLFAGNMFEKKRTGKVVGSAIGLLKSIDWLVKEKVHVINLSVAGGDNKVIRLALKKSQAKGINMVAAAGNWGKKGKPAYPAAYGNVLAITALHGNKSVYSHANQGSYIDFSAPGVKIWTAVPGGGKYQSGTSFASPYIAVFVALLSAGGTATSTDDIRNVLKRKIIDLGSKGKDSVFGYGFVNLEPKCR